MDRRKLMDKWFENHQHITREDYEFIKDIANRWDEEVDEQVTTIKQEVTITKQPLNRRILKLLEEQDGLTVQEVVKKIPDKEESSIRQTLYQMTYRDEIDSSQSRPKVYYLKSKGDPQVKEMTKNLRVEKMSYMG